ncbi:MAG: hypothetical protein K8R46_13820, partial [Pirellulales bacterium]|nr:hypothetical protein [Pirellulales bacterium]
MSISLKISLLLLVSALVGCNQVKLDSSWSNNRVTIDGELAEWTEGLLVPPRSQLAIAIRNDTDNLYLA